MCLREAGLLETDCGVDSVRNAGTDVILLARF